MDGRLLQNAPGARQFPVGLGQGFALQQHLIRAHWQLAWLGYGCGLVALLAGCVVYTLLTGDMDSPTSLLVTSAVFMAGLAGALGSVWRIFNTPRREQVRYLQLCAAHPLSEAQRQALRLDLVPTFWCGHWSERLEAWPSQAVLQGQSMRTYSFSLQSLEQPRKQLFSDWGIRSAEHYRRHQRDLRAGMHTPAFSQLLQGADDAQRKEIFAHLAFLTDLPEERIVALTQPTPDGRPPGLIWGFDLWRAITQSRTCYEAGYIEAEEAWRDLLATAELAHAIFDSFEEYWDSYRLGNAFWSNDFEICRARLKAWNYFQKCNWPLARLPWPPRPPGEALSEEIRSGFGLHPTARTQRDRSFLSVVRNDSVQHA